MRTRQAADEGPDETELAALADGSLTPVRRAELERRVAESRELAALLAEQERAVALVRSAAAEVDAPAGLRRRIEAKRSPVRAHRRGFAIAGGVATVAGVLALSLVVTLPGNLGPSVADAAVFATRPATAPAPTPAPGRPTLLSRGVEGVQFPNFARRFGWRASGSRADGLHGHRAVTVFFEQAGRRIAYTILSGKALRVPKGAAAVERKGVALRTFTRGGLTVVTWLRQGHTCVLAASGGPSRDVLLALAAWRGHGTIAF
jgi:anti-sigma factor RsiW